MNWNKKYTLIGIIILALTYYLSPVVFAQDLSPNIKNAFLKADAKLLSSSLDENIKLIILGETSCPNKEEAIRKLNIFFKNYPPKEFTAKFESRKKNSNFIIRSLKTVNDSFRVTIFFKKTDGNLIINLLRIEKENESVF